MHSFRRIWTRADMIASEGGQVRAVDEWAPMTKSTQSVRVRTSDAIGKIVVETRNGDAFLSAELTPQDVTDLVSALLKGGMESYLMAKDPKDPNYTRPLASVESIQAPVAWPLMVALASPHLESGRPAVGLCAAYGDVQVIVGLQRNQLPLLIRGLQQMDKALPKSDHFEGLPEPRQSKKADDFTMY